jgi:hypothetical protein
MEEIMNNMVRVLMKREDMTEQEVIQWIKDATKDMSDPEELLYEEFGLEPDYIFDLLEFV